MILFVSENTLERAENLHALFDAYQGEKRFEQGWETYCKGGFDVAVIDTMPPYMPNKQAKVVFIGHGIAGDKLYGFDQPIKYVDDRVRGQIDYAICSSSDMRMRWIVASQTGVKIDNVLPLGLPRTDALVNIGNTGRRVYLYVPTFRAGYEQAPLPIIDWQLLDSLMEDDELLIVKRHYFTKDPLVSCECKHIVEVGNQEPTTPYINCCGVVITDFSSIMFDGYIAGKPCVLAVDGMEGYLARRGMYLEYPSRYSSRWLTVEGHERLLLGKVRKAYEYGMTATETDCIDMVANRCDGHSCERTCDLIGGLL